ncbi:MAG: hypothetical protein D6681_11210 [Calditrichaeota bacterium]|nr:MAG: hypothetical protein D6681_11210 [Calditrichota bacterium]
MNSLKKFDSSKWLSVESVGMVSSIGLNAPSCCAAIRAGISRFEEIPFHDHFGNPIIAAPAIEAVPNRQGYQRTIQLLVLAIRECILSHPAHRKYIPQKVCLLIHIDTLDRPDFPENLLDYMAADINEGLGEIAPDRIEIYPEGKTGFFRSLIRARKILNDSHFDACIIAAGDSLVNGRMLAFLENNDRLKTEHNSDGVIPGEGAGALWVSRFSRQVKSMLIVAGIGLNKELSVLEKDKPTLGIGLANAIKESLKDAGIPLHSIDFRIGSIAGERLDFMEASTALARVQRVHKDHFELWLPAEQLGDTGVALPACMTIIAAVAFSKGYAPGRSALVFSSSRSAERAASIVLSTTGLHNA